MKVKLCSNLAEARLDAAEWNALVRDEYPFLRHEFLSGLEAHECVGEEYGWLPRHLLCFDDDDKLLGAMPLYEKHNSWGEFVFDHVWADAFHRAGLAYYPKLVNAVPFTPASGQRVLASPSRKPEVLRALQNAAREIMQRGGFSGLHSLFVDARDYESLHGEHALTRVDCQFHWHNRDYADFDSFLSTLKAKKRKNILQERRKVKHAGVAIRRLDGRDATAQDWSAFSRLYEKIYERKYGRPAFTREFFVAFARARPTQVVLLLAEAGDECVAAALMYRDKHTLYGRHWGCARFVDALHFELCYYQGIEYCIEHGLQRFDPGAQGEHKIARGFLPTQTRSLHWMADARFRRAIGDFVRREGAGVAHYIDVARAHSPYQHSHA